MAVHYFWCSLRASLEPYYDKLSRQPSPAVHSKVLVIISPYCNLYIARMCGGTWGPVQGARLLSSRPLPSQPSPLPQGPIPMSVCCRTFLAPQTGQVLMGRGREMAFASSVPESGLRPWAFGPGLAAGTWQV